MQKLEKQRLPMFSAVKVKSCPINLRLIVAWNWRSCSIVAMQEPIRAIDAPLIQALCAPAVYDHDVESVRVIETHISWVLLTGSFVYKIKKPVRLPFLDFSTLRQRREFCEEEVRLNQRLAPDLYLGVIPIGGSIDKPVIGIEPAIEYAVKLREFPAGARLDERLGIAEVPVEDVIELAETIADFHGSLPSSKRYGSAMAITRTVTGNVRETEQLLRRSERRTQLATLRDWICSECVELERAFADRWRYGAIRECHGDLHLENLAYCNNRIVPFDALEFDPGLRWIDVMDETAFLVMDLIAHDRADLAHEFLNRYLEITGDYSGLEVFRFYLVHRAVVRTKVAAIKGSQLAGSVDCAGAPVDRYLRCARKLIESVRPLLVLTHGLSGSGKTTVTNRLISILPAIRCRSDLERKRLHGLAPREKSGSPVRAGLYTESASQATYATLRQHVARGLRAGLNVVVDAAFLGRADREGFIRLAATEGSPVVILDCRAPEHVLRERIHSRAAQNLDVSEATVEVLDSQLATRESFAPEELEAVVAIDTDQDIDYEVLAQRIRTSVPVLQGQALSSAAK
jgi:aminoglycoside phosphotransferase family enzyme/predicted kinase